MLIERLSASTLLQPTDKWMGPATSPSRVVRECASTYKHIKLQLD